MNPRNRLQLIQEIWDEVERTQLRNRICALYDQGYDSDYIARHCGINEAVVIRVIIDYEARRIDDENSI